MSFKDREVNFSGGFDKTKKTEFMTLSQGAHTIRILQPQPKTVPTHFFPPKTTVLCLGDDCPVCANNKKLIMQFPENFRDQAGYSKINWRFFVNVLDKTPAKVCECGKVHKALATTICTCGKVLPAASPLNKVVVLSKGITLRDDLDSIDNAILDNSGTPVGITNYDIVLMVSGTGRDTKVTPVPRTEANQPVPEGLELYDLDKATIVLEPAEMLDAQRGVSLRDIFSARKNSNKQVASVEPVVGQEVIDEVNNAVNSLFNISQ